MRKFFLVLSFLTSFLFAQTAQSDDIFTAYPKLTAGAVIAFLLYVTKFFYDKSERTAKENHDQNAQEIEGLKKEVSELNVYIKTEFHSIIEKNNQLFEKILEKLDNEKS